MKLNKILGFFSAAALLLGGTACQDSVKYDPTPAYTGDEVYFSADAPDVLDIETDATSVNFNLYRVNGNGTLTVAIEGSVKNQEGTDMTDIFSVPTQVIFPEGVTEVSVPVSVVFENVTPEYDYTLSVKIADEFTSPYGLTSYSATITYAPWSEMEEQEGEAYVALAGVFAGEEYEVPFGMAQSLVNPNKVQYYFPSVYSNLNTDFYISIDKEKTIEVDGTICYRARMNEVNSGYHNGGDGPIFMFWDIFSWVEWVNDYQATEEQVLRVLERNDWWDSYFNPMTGAFHINMITYPEYDGESKTSYYNTGDLYIQLPGYATPWIDIMDMGTTVDATGYEVKNMNITTNDIASYKYQLLAGEITGDALEAAYAAMMANEDILAQTERSLDLVFDIDFGKYTMIVEGVATNGVEVKAAKTIDYQSVLPASPYKTIGWAEYTDGFMRTINQDYGVVTVYAEVQQSQDDPGLYRIKNAYREWAAAVEEPELALPGNYYIYLDASDKTCVLLETSVLGVKPSRETGGLIGYSRAAEMFAEGRTKAAIKLAKQNGQMKNNVITFPAKSLYLSYEVDYPTWMEANSPANFKLDLTTLKPTKPETATEEVIRGRVNRINMFERNQTLDIRTVLQ